MKIEIKTGVITVGMLKKSKFQEVKLFVELTEEEKSIIKEYNLENHVIMERDAPASSDSKFEFNLTFKSLVQGSDEYNLPLPLYAKNYIEQLTERLKWAKSFLDGNATLPQGVTMEL